jgi:hypothetical protein
MLDDSLCISCFYAEICQTMTTEEIEAEYCPAYTPAEEPAKMEFYAGAE